MQVQYLLNETQQEFASTTREILTKNCPLELVSSVYEAHRAGSAATQERKAIRTVVENIGAFGIMVPEESGGVGLSEVEASLFCFEAGYAALPLPVVPTLWCAPMLVAAGVTSPENWVSVGQVDPEGYVSHCTDVEYLINLECDDASISHAGDLSELVNVVDWASPVGQVASGERVLRLSHEEALHGQNFLKLGYSAYLLGLAERALELTVEYVGNREQFGVPVGSFQAVKHHLADAQIALTCSGPTLWHSVFAYPGPTSELDLATAQVMVGLACRKVARAAIQCHGGMGCTTEYPLHLLCKRIWFLDSSIGDNTQNVFHIAGVLGLSAT